LLVATGVGQITGVGRISDVAPYVLSAEAKGAPKTFKDCAKHCPEMVVVPAGEFTMGSLEGREHGHKRETPQHKVTIAHPFAVSRFEVTFKQWDACAAARGCKNRPSDSGWGRGTRPVINVGWDDAKEYVAWLSNSTHKPYRLLSEAEWEYAARAGTTTNFSFESDKALGEHAWYDDNSKKMTHPVGQKKPNSFGLYDMHGNVWEWVEDSWHDSYEGAPSDGTAWRQQGDPSLGVLRGGSWSSSGYFLRSANRFQSTGEEDEIGFRVARTLGP
jgi:formylglycine-generating enzyme required for sulfatase activity